MSNLSEYDNIWLLKDEATCIGLRCLVNSYEQMSEMCELFGWVVPSKDHPSRPSCSKIFVFFASVNTWGCFICPIRYHQDDTNIFSSGVNERAPTNSRYSAENYVTAGTVKITLFTAKIIWTKPSEFLVSAINWLQHFSIEILSDWCL